MALSRLLPSCLVSLATAAACSPAGPGAKGFDGGGGSGAATVGGTGGTAGTIVVTGGTSGGVGAPMRQCTVCDDLPADPIVVDGTPANARDLFSGTGSGAGPCLAEPADGALFPWNWLRPRIRWVGNSDVYEVRISAENQRNTLVVYTNRNEYYVPREVWFGTETNQGLARNSYEMDITVTVRGATLAGAVTSGASAKFRSAAIDAGGTMVYWANVKTQTSDSPADGDASGWLVGFAAGDESVVEALRVMDVTTPTRTYAAQSKPVACIGCHTSTPDGEAVSFTSFWPWSGAIAGITEQNRGALPAFVTPVGLAALQQMWMGGWTYSPAHWREGYRVGVASYGASSVGWPDGDHNKTNRDGLLWVNLAATAPAPVPAQDWEVRQNWAPMANGTALGILPRTGDTRAALMPDFAHDGTTIAYTSTSSSLDGRIGEINDTDIYTVPFNSGSGGTATPLAGAAAAGVAEYYPNYSADDAFVAFNRIANVNAISSPNPQGFDNHLYYRPESEIWIAPARGGVTAAGGETSDGGAIRLKANDPDSCNTLVASRRGLSNSWAKFSPRVNTVEGKTYYWLIFSSSRDTPESQRVAVTDPQYKPVETLYSRLFMAAFTVEGGRVTTHPAVYLWNQDESSNNLTPAWDEFKIPDVPPPQEPR